MKEFNSWKDIRDWAEENGYNLIAKRMDLNNACWNSSGEFGRSQVDICDALRFAKSDDERLDIADQIEYELSDDDVLTFVGTINNDDLNELKNTIGEK